MEQVLGLTSASKDINGILTLLSGNSGWNQLNGMKVLDLACGTEFDTYGRPGYFPYFARLCAQNGAQVIGVDIGYPSENDAKLFTHLQADIATRVKKGTLVNLPDLAGQEFDIVHSRKFACLSPDPILEKMLKRWNMDTGEFRRLLIDQAKGFLRPGGVLSIEDHLIQN